MMQKSRQQPVGGGISSGMRIALIITVILTALSFGIKKWRQSSSDTETAQEAGNRDNQTASVQASASTTPGLRPEVPAAKTNPMGPRNAPQPSPVEKAPDQAPPPPPPPPPPVQLEPPAFRLIGAHVDGRRWTAFFAHGKGVIAARPGKELPGGFRLRSINRNSATIIRSSNREKIEMPLEMPK